MPRHPYPNMIVQGLMSSRVLSRRKQLQWILYFAEGFKANLLREAQLGAFTLDAADLELLRKMYDGMDSYINRLKVRMK